MNFTVSMWYGTTTHRKRDFTLSWNRHRARDGKHIEHDSLLCQQVDDLVSSALGYKNMLRVSTDLLIFFPSFCAFTHNMYIKRADHSMKISIT
jgi:hypothetical protein